MKFVVLLLLMQSTSIFAQDGDELPAISTNNKNFFIPEAIYRKYNLEMGQNDEWMKVYNSKSIDTGIQRVNDIRWQGKDKTEATIWYKANGKLLAEDGEDITGQLPRPAGVDNWNVYGQSKQMQKMMKALGIEQNHYDFTFTVDKYVAKIFVATSGKESLKDAWQFAKEGLKATLTATGKPELAKLVL